MDRRDRRCLQLLWRSVLAVLGTATRGTFPMEVKMNGVPTGFINHTANAPLGGRPDDSK